MAKFFIADTHFGHKNILSYDNRPFPTIEAHDKAIMDNWNSVVSETDDIYILGDISWHNVVKTIEILRNLKGQKHLIIGNHDKDLLKKKEFREIFVEITDYLELPLGNGKGIVLSHYPIPCFNNHYYGWYHLYGHTHNSFEENMMQRVKYEMETLYDAPCNMFNVGVMINYMNYTPQTLDSITLKAKKD